MNPFKRVIIVDAKVHIIRASRDPIFSNNKFCCSHWHVTDLNLHIYNYLAMESSQ